MKGVGTLELYNKPNKNFQTIFVFKSVNVKTLHKDRCLLCGKSGGKSLLGNKVLEEICSPQFMCCVQLRRRNTLLIDGRHLYQDFIMCWRILMDLLSGMMNGNCMWREKINMSYGILHILHIRT